MNGVLNRGEGTELWLRWIHVVCAAMKLVALNQQNVASAVCSFPPFVVDIIVDLELDVPGNPHMATEALALVSIEVQVRKLDQVPFGFENGGSEDEGVVAVFAKASIPI